MLECKICSYKTESKSHFIVHSKSRKHILKLQAHDSNIDDDQTHKKEYVEFELETLKVDFRDKECGYYKLQKIVVTQREEIQSLIKWRLEHEKKLSDCEKKLIEKEGELKLVLEKLEHVKELSLRKDSFNTQHTNNVKIPIDNKDNLDEHQTSSCIALLRSNCTATLPIAELDSYDNLTDVNETKPLFDVVLHNTSRKTLDEFIYKILVKNYVKMEAPQTQGIWIKDLMRKTFFIRITKNGSNQWVIDKRGLILTKIIIVPLLKHINTVVLNGSNDLGKRLDEKSVTPLERDLIPKKQAICADAMSLLDTDRFINKVLDKVAHHFNIEQLINTPDIVKPITNQVIPLLPIVKVIEEQPEQQKPEAQQPEEQPGEEPDKQLDEQQKEQQEEQPNEEPEEQPEQPKKESLEKPVKKLRRVIPRIDLDKRKKLAHDERKAKLLRGGAKIIDAKVSKREARKNTK